MADEVLYDSDAMRRFAGIELGDDRIPDETTILNFRHLLEKHQLTEKLFAEVNRHLADQAITLCSGTLVDATIIDARSRKTSLILCIGNLSISPSCPLRHQTPM